MTSAWPREMWALTRGIGAGNGGLTGGSARRREAAAAQPVRQKPGRPWVPGSDSPCVIQRSGAGHATAKAMESVLVSDLDQ